MVVPRFARGHCDSLPSVVCRVCVTRDLLSPGEPRVSGLGLDSAHSRPACAAIPERLRFSLWFRLCCGCDDLGRLGWSWVDVRGCGDGGPGTPLPGLRVGHMGPRRCVVHGGDSYCYRVCVCVRVVCGSVVEFASPAAMRKAINMLDGSTLDGREITVRQVRRGPAYVHAAACTASTTCTVGG